MKFWDILTHNIDGGHFIQQRRQNVAVQLGNPRSEQSPSELWLKSGLMMGRLLIRGSIFLMGGLLGALTEGCGCNVSPEGREQQIT